MQPPTNETWGNSPERKISFNDVLKLIIGMALIASLLWFVNYLSSAGIKPAVPDEKKAPPPTWSDEKVFTYTKDRITYLVFYDETSNGIGMSVQNYTADSLRMVEYIDFEESIKDTSTYSFGEGMDIWTDQDTAISFTGHWCIYRECPHFIK